MHEPARVAEHLVTVAAADGVLLQASRFGAAVHGSVVLASALGVPRRFYRAFASALAARGFAAWTFDYRGIGDSPVRESPRMRTWGEQDIDAVLRAALAAAPRGRLMLVGHSCGGQLPGLAPTSERLDRAVLVAATAPRASLYPWPGRFSLSLLWHVLIPLLSRQRDYLPGWLMGQGSAQFPAAVVREWAQWARSDDYLFDPAHGIDTARYARLRFPILSLGFDDDPYAPPPAIDALLRHYAAAPIERRLLRAAAHGGPIGHFGFFRSRPGLWDPVLDWLARA